MLNFPNSPSSGTIFSSPDGSRWQFDNTKWVVIGPVAGSSQYLPLAGGTMLGSLTLAGPPTANLQATTKQYTDTTFLLLSGGTLTGPLILSANPTAPLQAATKQYTDLFLPLSGGTLSGPLYLSGSPTTALQAATKGYTDLFLPLGGGTLSGRLVIANGAQGISYTGVLNGNHAFCFGWDGTHIQCYVDNTYVGGMVFGGPYLPLSGGTLSGRLALSPSANGVDLVFFASNGNYMQEFHDGTNGQIAVVGGNLYLTSSTNNVIVGSSTTSHGFVVQNNSGSYLIIYDDGNSHIASTSQLWIDSYTVFGGNISVGSSIYWRGNNWIARDGNYTVIYDAYTQGAIFLGGPPATNYYRNTTHVFQNVNGGVTICSWTASSATFSVPFYANSGANVAGGLTVNPNLAVGGTVTAGYLYSTGDIRADNNLTVASGLYTNYIRDYGTAQIDGAASVGGAFTAGSVTSLSAVVFNNDGQFYISAGSGYKVLNWAAQWYITWNTNNGDLTVVRGGAGDHTCFEAASGILNCRSGPVRGVGAYQDFSDLRMKQDITPIHYGLDTLLQLKPVSFKRLPRGHFNLPDNTLIDAEPRVELGFIAQDVIEVLPEAVHDGEQMAISTGMIIPVLVAALQELATRVKQLEGGTASTTGTPLS
jgi:hypothetical protein